MLVVLLKKSNTKWHIGGNELPFILSTGQVCMPEEATTMTNEVK